MSLRKALGAALVIPPFAVIAAAIFMRCGWLKGLLVIGLTLAIIGGFALGLRLLFED